MERKSPRQFAAAKSVLAAILVLGLLILFSSTALAEGGSGPREPDAYTFTSAPWGLSAKLAAVPEAPHQPLVSLVYVDDSWVRTTLGSDPDGAGPASSFGTDSFATIQDGIDAVAAGGTVNVYPGTYSETASNRYLYNATGPYQFGLFIDVVKAGITVQGVDAGGTPIASYSGVLADVTTNATNSFGYSGVFVEANGVTITGLEILPNVPYDNKTIEVIGDNFTLKYSHLDISPDGGSVYFNDWRYDTGTNTSYVQSYTVEGNWLDHGTSIDIASGAGYSGLASSRKIINNKFSFAAGQYWPGVSFNGSGTGVPWFVYSVGGAVITGNEFSGGEQYVRTRGTVDLVQFDWASYWNNNTFDRAVVATTDGNPANVRSYSYTGGYGLIDPVRRIGATISLPHSAGCVDNDCNGEMTNAQSGDTVLVADGTYEEAVVIDAKTVTLKGESVATVVKSPATIPTCFTTKKAVICVSNNADATIDTLTIDGAGRGNMNYQFNGVAFHNAGGAVMNSAILDIRDNSFSGEQHGVAIYSYNEDAVARTIDVLNNVITGFQKNAMALNASPTTPLTVQVNGNTVTGAGTTAVTAQNGIQIGAILATGTVANNSVSGIAYGGTGWVATSILDYSDVDIVGNTLSGCHMCVYKIEGTGQISGNTLNVIKAGGYSWGIVATDPPEAVPAPFDAQGFLPTIGAGPEGANATLTVDVSNNTVSFSGGDNSASYGIEADAGYGVDDLAVTANDNVVTGFEVGIEIWQCQSTPTFTCSAGEFTSVVASDNCLDGNDYGMRSNVTYLTVDGRDNWWGDDTGPYNAATNPGGAGADVSDGIDFVPWVIDGCGSSTLAETELSASTDNALFCTGETTDVFIDLAAVADLYGYQFEVSYDDSLVDAAGVFVYSFFDTNGSGTVPPVFPDPAWNADCTTTPGTCKFARVELYPDPAVSGSGTLAQITLTGVVPGTFEMEISNSLLSTINGAVIGHTLGDDLPITVCGLTTISGYVTLQGRFSGNVDTGTVELTEQDVPANFSPISPATFSNSNGFYTFTNVPFMPGGSNYKIRAKHGLYLDNAKSILVTGPLTGQNTLLRGGDANNTGNISIADLSCIGGSFGGPVVGSCDDGSSDINADGVINIQDLSIAAGNYTKASPQPW